MLCGMIWSPFMHLSANIIQVRFDLPEETAALQASVLLSGAMVLYPIVGHITDRRGSATPRTTFELFLITSILTLVGYIALSLPTSWVRSAWPGLIPWALGHGASPLLLVVLVARILPVDLVPLGLGMHKALETAASTGFQTLSGLWLDFAKEANGEPDDDNKGEEEATHSLLWIFAALNVLQLVGAIVLWRFESKRRHEYANHPNAEHEHAEQYSRLPRSVDEERSALGLSIRDRDDDSDTESLLDIPELGLLKGETEPQSGLARTDAERSRARVSFKLCLAFIASVWILFIAVAWTKL
jgi:MFS family permease